MIVNAVKTKNAGKYAVFFYISIVFICFLWRSG